MALSTRRSFFGGILAAAAAAVGIGKAQLADVVPMNEERAVILRKGEEHVLYEGDLGYRSQPAPHLIVTGVDYKNKTITFGESELRPRGLEYFEVGNRDLSLYDMPVNVSRAVPTNSIVFLGYDGLWEFDGRQTVAINNLKPPEGY